jgi:CheY-like chemotaxis protein
MPRLYDNSRVLIVDDERIVAQSLAAVFMSRGYDAKVASSAEQGVEVAAGWQPDLAVLDIALPAMNGIDLAIALKTRYPTCRILLFSGYVYAYDLLEPAAKEGHLFEIMAKPVHPTFMLERAAELLST